MINNRDIIKELRKLKSAQPDSGFVAKNREKLMAVLNAEKIRGQEKKELAKFRNIWYDVTSTIFYKLARPAGVFLLIMCLLTGGGVGISFASYNSVPGDVFYPVKLTIEKAQVSMQTKEEDKVKLEVEFAGRRIEEFNKVREKEKLENKKAPENTKVALDNFKKNIETAQARLEKIKEQKFTEETAKIMSLVEEKTTEYAAALKNISDAAKADKDKELSETDLKSEPIETEENNSADNEQLNGNNTDAEDSKEDGKEQMADAGIFIDSTSTSTPIATSTSAAETDKIEENLNGSATSTDAIATATPIVAEKNEEVKDADNKSEEIKVLKEALEISENLSIKAVDIIIDKKNSGEINISKEEIANKVKNKADNLKTKVDVIKDKVAEIKSDSKDEEDKKMEIALPAIKQENLKLGNNNDVGTSTKDTVGKTNAENITKIDYVLNEVNGLLEQGDFSTAFGKVKEANELKKSVENKIDQESLEAAKTGENSNEQEK
ncbi:hypothetical protein A3J77_02125 [Candidatus Wolfebacteria bacterium RBG_13_41_7]|uniref:DUF5667 domain-containing protein n=1 Tax=Candidatus Wolfebacteria bacterium RBG_13_41_7 TaxID=1802554 RepID=A0A1F8DP36_9BACT|nr:MAG: hypothetical protein A3J77_02125 [Candidatus Wolfebacteria bacterium RBG_13_41_7]